MKASISFRSWTSIGAARSLVLTALVAILPLTVFASVSALVAVQAKQSELTAQAVADARALVQSVDRELAADENIAGALAASPTLDSLADLKPFEEVARRERARHSGWMSVNLSDLSGQWLFNTNSPERRRVVEPTSFERVLRTGQPQVGAFARGGLGLYGLPVRAPVIRNGKILAVVTVVEQPAGLRALIGELQTPAQWIVTIVSQDDQIVARSQGDAKFVGGHASERAEQARRRGGYGVYPGLTLEGVPTMSAYAVSPSGWSVHIGVPTALLRGPLDRLIALLSGAFLVCILLAGLGVYLLLRDVEGRRAHAATIEQATRIEALGRLTGGVAHDFNNLLTVIQGNAEILSRRLPDTAVAERPLAAIKTASERASQLTRQLLVFARGGVIERASVDVGESIAEATVASAEIAGSGVEVTSRIEPNLPRISVDPIQFQAALINLIANARDAMDGQGRIDITASVQGGETQIAVRDRGPGFAKAALARAFEPFYTTKPIGRGTGLGLAQVYGFVHNCGGRVSLGNAPDGGAVVRMAFPADAGADGAPGTPVPTNKAGGRILLVDDNEAVRAAAAAYLRDSGYEVAEAPGADPALDLLREKAFDAVVSDIAMPGEHDGMALAQILAVEHPGLPVLLVTGYSGRAAEAQGKGMRVLAKPYSLAELERRVRTLTRAA